MNDRVLYLPERCPPREVVRGGDVGKLPGGPCPTKVNTPEVVRGSSPTEVIRWQLPRGYLGCHPLFAIKTRKIRTVTSARRSTTVWSPSLLPANVGGRPRVPPLRPRPVRARRHMAPANCQVFFWIFFYIVAMFVNHISSGYISKYYYIVLLLLYILYYMVLLLLLY